jgi:hypothetical protein
MDDRFLTIKCGDTVMRVHAETLAQLLLSGIPDAIRNPDSPDRKQHDNMWLMAKGFLRSFVPPLFKLFFKQTFPKVPPGSDIISYTTELACLFVSEGVAGREVTFLATVEQIEGDKITYNVLDVVTDTDDQTDRTATIAANGYPAV